MYVPVFQKIGEIWRASVDGATAEGRTKRLAQRALKRLLPNATNVRWVREDSPFFK